MAISEMRSKESTVGVQLDGHISNWSGYMMRSEISSMMGVKSLMVLLRGQPVHLWAERDRERERGEGPNWKILRAIAPVLSFSNMENDEKMKQAQMGLVIFHPNWGCSSSLAVMIQT